MPTPTPTLLQQQVLGILGPTGVTLPLVGAAPARFTTLGSPEAAFDAVFTWSEPLADFDTPTSFQGIIPVVTFNGIDEEADTPDITYFSRGDGSNDSPVSMGAWINIDPDASDDIAILTKYTSSAREWEFVISGANNLRLIVYDRLAVFDPVDFSIVFRWANATRTQLANLTRNVWVFVVITYDGTGGSNALGSNGSSETDNARVFVDGAIVASLAGYHDSYVAMEDLVGLPTLGIRGGRRDSLFNGKMAGGPLGPFFTHKELSAGDVSALYEMGREALGLWSSLGAADAVRACRH